jgi:hypothetical protein
VNSKIFKLLGLSLALVGCAHHTNPEAKRLPAEWRVGEGRLTTGMPNYPLSPEVFARTQQKRGPASVALSDKELAESIEQDEKKPSLRRLYFRALYQQWVELNHVSKNTEVLKSCPQYHHDKVVLDETRAKPALFVTGTKPEAGHLAYYPEWALQVKSGGSMKPVWQTQGKKHMQKALQRHAGKLKRELAVMCEEGASDAYFRLENMVTYMVQKPEFQGQEGLQALLKIPVFSTMLLMKSLQGEREASFGAHDVALLNEVKGFQLQSYIVELKKQRQQLVTGSL